MAEIPLPEDEAARYVLGEMDAAERHQFEARLEKSDDLRALVRELESGTVAAAFALPQREPPGQVWQRIEEVVAEETKQEAANTAFWRIIRRQGGWWAAAACLIGWMLYAIWMNHAGTSGNPVGSPPVLSENNARFEAAPTESPRVEHTRLVSSQPALTNTIASRPPLSALARTGVSAALRLLALPPVPLFASATLAFRASIRSMTFGSGFRRRALRVSPRIFCSTRSWSAVR